MSSSPPSSSPSQPAVPSQQQQIDSLHQYGEEEDHFELDELEAMAHEQEHQRAKEELAGHDADEDEDEVQFISEQQTACSAFVTVKEEPGAQQAYEQAQDEVAPHQFDAEYAEPDAALMQYAAEYQQNIVDDRKYEQKEVLATSIDDVTRPPYVDFDQLKLDSEYHGLSREAFLHACKSIGIRTVSDFLLKYAQDEGQSVLNEAKKRKTFRGAPLSDADVSNLESDIRRISHEISVFMLRAPVLSLLEIEEQSYAESMDVKQQNLSSGCPILDKEIFRGGFRTQMITELFGEAGSGKSQLVTQLMIQCVLPFELGGLNGSALLLFTEGRFSNTRLDQMLDEKLACWKKDETTLNLLQQNGINTSQDIMDSIHVREFNHGLGEFEFVLKNGLEKTINELKNNPDKRSVKLLVIDSIAALFRGSDQVANTFDRANRFVEISEKLKKLAYDHNICIVVTNQVTDKFNDAERASFRFNASSNEMLNGGKADVTEDVLDQLARKIAAEQRMRTPSDEEDDEPRRPSSGQPLRRFGPGPIMSRTNALKLPALGLAWSNCINMRIMVQKRTATIEVREKCLSNKSSDASFTQALMSVGVKRKEPSEDEEDDGQEEEGQDGDTPAAKRQRLDNGTAASSGVARRGRASKVEQLSSHTHRVFHVIFSPYAKTHSCSFFVNDYGVKGTLYDNDTMQFVTCENIVTS